jgi:glycosyltransferase involved in cell wall biosynthesis
MTPSTTPVVSVITATRNRADLLERTLKSIRAQDLDSFEAIVVDDGSEASILDRYPALWQQLDDRFILERPVAPGAPGTGPGAARNRGIRRARGEFIAFLDDDDEWLLNNHLSVGVSALQRTGADYYFANMQGHRDGRILCPDWFPDTPQLTAGPRISDSPPVYEVPRRAFMRALQRHHIHPDNVIVPRTLLERIGGFVNRITHAEDVNLTLRLADVAGTVLYRPDIVVSYRFPEGNSVSLTYSRMEAYLHTVMAFQHVRANCQRADIRRVARAKEGWTLRELADLVEQSGLRGEALLFRWQSLCAYPTLRAAWALAGGCGRGFAAWFRPIARPAGPRLSGSLRPEA